MTPTCIKTQKGMDCTMEIDTSNYPSGTYPLELQMCNGAQCDKAETSFTVQENPPELLTPPASLMFFFGVALIAVIIYLRIKK